MKRGPGDDALAPPLNGDNMLSVVQRLAGVDLSTPLQFEDQAARLQSVLARLQAYPPVGTTPGVPAVPAPGTAEGTRTAWPRTAVIQQFPTQGLGLIHRFSGTTVMNPLGVGASTSIRRPQPLRQ